MPIAKRGEVWQVDLGLAAKNSQKAFDANAHALVSQCRLWHSTFSRTAAIFVWITVSFPLRHQELLVAQNLLK